MHDINHSFDLTVEDSTSIQVMAQAKFFAAESEERVEDGFDCAGTFGTAGTMGGTFGSVGTFGCCC